MKKTITKVLALILVVSILLPANMAFAADSSSAKILENLGIAKTVKFPYFHLNYSRIEFAKMLHTMDSGIVGAYDVSVVKDVAEVDAPYAAYAVERKLLSLDKDGNFNPNAKVIYKDAVTALLRLVGYDAIAEEMGGKTSDYMSLAKKSKLTNGINAAEDAVLTKEELAAMILNAIEIKSPEVSNGGVIMDEGTILERMDIISGEGKLLANDSFGIGAAICDEGYVNIDGNVIPTDIAVDDSYVGKVVYYYIRQDGHKKSLVALENLGGESLTLTANDIYDVEFGSRTLTFKYDDGKKISVPHTALAIINGKPGNLSKELFDSFKSGELELINGDGNGSYDAVNMTSCTTAVVEVASADSKVINARYTGRRYELDNGNNVLVVYENGKKTTMNAVKPGSVVSIACDAYTITGGVINFDFENARYIKVYVSNKTYSGVLESMSDTEYYVDGSGFIPNSILKNASDSGIKNKLDAGNTYSFRLDEFDTLCDYDLLEEGAAMEYGYLMEAGVVNDGFSSGMQVRILNLKNDIITYTVKEKYYLDGIKEAIEGSYALPDVLSGRQLIRYSVSGGIITEIDTATVSKNEIEENTLSRDSGDLSGACRYWENLGGFEDHRAMITPNTKVFVVSDDPAAKDTAFKVETTSLFQSSQAYKFEAFDIADMGDTSCIVVHQAVDNSVSNHTHIYMVEKFVKTLNTEGDLVNRMYLHGYDGSIIRDLVNESELMYKDYSLSTNNNLSDIKKGDLVRFSVNSSNEITSLERVFTVTAEPALELAELKQGGVHYEYGMFYNTSSTYFEAVGKEDMSGVTDADKMVFGYKFPKRVPVYNMKDGTVKLYSSSFGEIPTYISTAERVTVFLHMVSYEHYGTAVYIWE